MSEIENDVKSVLKTGEVELKNRIFAYLIDSIIFFIVPIVVIGILTSIVPKIGFLMPIAYLAGFVLFLLRDSVFSKGKDIMKYEAYDVETGSNLKGNHVKSAIRNGILAILGIIDIIFLFIGEKKGRLGDMIAKTNVRNK